VSDEEAFRLARAMTLKKAAAGLPLAMGWIRDEMGRSAGLPRELGGIPLDEIDATGFGLTIAIEVAAEHIGLKLKGARVVI
jgi:glutamate dehydrogenase (NAD(P)+)